MMENSNLYTLWQDPEIFAQQGIEQQKRTECCDPLHIWEIGAKEAIFV